jgi:hypothetical protein
MGRLAEWLLSSSSVGTVENMQSQHVDRSPSVGNVLGSAGNGEQREGPRERQSNLNF